MNSQAVASRTRILYLCATRVHWGNSQPTSNHECLAPGDAQEAD